nr:hypothetical protein [Kofleriaceae bacterium]
MTRWFLSALAAALAVASCHHDGAPPIAPPPVRDAVGDAELREMVAEVAAQRACERIVNHFHALRSPDHHDIVDGVMWVHGCTSSHSGTDVTFTVLGSGWQWEDKQKHEVGGTFAVRQYVKFTATATIAGTLDLGYDQASHVASLWFSPKQAATVDLEPIGNIAVKTTGTWSQVVGAVGSLFSKSPAQAGVDEAKQQGRKQFLRQLADGLTVTVDLCSGVVRSSPGRLPRGQMAPPDVLEPSQTELELEPGGLMVLGPQRAKAGMTVHVDAKGPVDVMLACVDDASEAARAYLEGNPTPGLTPLATASGPGSADLSVAAETCPVAVIARTPLSAKQPTQFSVQRSSSEIGFANGGPLAGCSAR